MRAQPLVSVVIPTYNCADYLPEAIDSALAQTYRPLEILVVDDGSTDQTADVLARYRGRITVLSQANRGPAAARNLGIRHAQGELVAFLDADDVWKPEKLAQQVAVLADHPEVGVVCTDGDVVKGTTVISQVSKNHEALRAWLARRGHGESVVIGSSEWVLSFGCCIATSSVVIRTSCFARVGGFNEFVPFEEYDLFRRLSRHYPFAFIQQCVMSYRVREGSVSQSSRWDYQQQRLEEQFVKMREGELPVHNASQLSQRLTASYWSRGWTHLDEGSLQDARWHFLRSLRHTPFHWPSYPYLAASCLPRRAVRALKRVKQRVMPAAGLHAIRLDVRPMPHPCSAQPLVSVVIATYNCARYLPEAIESVLAQTYRNVELIVVDDGSTDQTAAVLERYRGRVQILVQTNRGPAVARNTGIRHSTGELVAFLDADDVWFPTTVQRVVEVFRQFPQAALTFIDGQDFDESGLLSRTSAYRAQQAEFHLWRKRHQADERVSIGPIYTELLSKNCIGGASVVTVRRACLEEVGAFDEQLRFVEDYELWLRICQRAPVAFLNEPLMRYRIRPDSLCGPHDARLAFSRKASAIALARHLPKVPHEFRAAVRARIVAYYRKGGWNYFRAGHLHQARSMYGRCLRWDWTQVGVLPYLAASYLPLSLIEQLRRAKRSLAHGVSSSEFQVSPARLTSEEPGRASSNSKPETRNPKLLSETR